MGALRFSFSLTTPYAGLMTLALGALNPATAQQQSSAFSSSTASENNGQDFTRPQNLFQLRYVY